MDIGRVSKGSGLDIYSETSVRDLFGTRRSLDGPFRTATSCISYFQQGSIIVDGIKRRLHSDYCESRAEFSKLSKRAG